MAPADALTATAVAFMSEFESIRPYRDDEVQAVLQRLTADRGFLSVLARFLLPRPLWSLEGLVRNGL